MTVLPFPPRLRCLDAPSDLERLGHARQGMLKAFATLIERGVLTRAETAEEIDGTGAAMLALMEIMEARNG